jgi:hypothetical protein
MLYAAKCYWPGVSENDVARVGPHAPGPHGGVSYLGSLLFAEDNLVLCLFEGPSRAAVMRASELAGIPCERVMDSVWLGATWDPRRGANDAS